MALGTAGSSRGMSPFQGVMPLAIATTIVLVGLAAIVVWLATSGPILPPPVTVSVQAQASLEPAPAAEASAAPLRPQLFPDPDLLENSPSGPLPVVSLDGRMARDAYAAPFDKADKRPRIAILIDDLASSISLTNMAIQNLPGPVTLSFMPYRRDLGQLTMAAHAAGHEIMLDLPMEPPDTNRHDPGPNALRTALDAPTNVARLDWMMARATGYVGMAAFLGGRFESERADMQPILKEIYKRGLLYVDNKAAAQSIAPLIATEMGLPFAIASVVIDADPTRGAIDQRLAELEQDAQRDGHALGIAAASDAVIQRVGAWAATLNDKHLVLAPVSAVATTAPKPAVP